MNNEIETAVAFNETHLCLLMSLIHVSEKFIGRFDFFIFKKKKEFIKIDLYKKNHLKLLSSEEKKKKEHSFSRSYSRNELANN